MRWLHGQDVPRGSARRWHKSTSVSTRRCGGERRGDVVFLEVREPVECEHHIPVAVQILSGLLEFVGLPTAEHHAEI